MQQTHHLPDNERIALDYFDTTGQPINNEGVLFDRFYLSIGEMTNLFAVDIKDWRKVDDRFKEQGWEMVTVTMIYIYFLLNKLIYILKLTNY